MVGQSIWNLGNRGILYWDKLLNDNMSMFAFLSQPLCSLVEDGLKWRGEGYYIGQ